MHTYFRHISLGTVLAITITAPALPAQSPRSPLDGLDADIRRGMHSWHVPGLAVAVVKDDSIVFSRGYGVREVGKPWAVDEKTIFAIGSNTKLFTAVATGMLVDDGRMHWDDPVSAYLPGFELYDPWVTREITIRDVLSHRSGLGERGALISYGRDYDRAEVLRRLRYLVPNSSFRSQFGYQNYMVLAAGEAAAAAAHESWDALVEQRIFTPLGMSRTTTSVTQLAELPNVATPHASDATSAIPIPWRNIDNVGPAGSINSSIADMAKWVRFLLAGGRVRDTSLIRPTTLAEIESPQTIIPVGRDSLRPSIHFAAYGLGVMMYDYRGSKVLTHTGGIDGMLSMIVLVPEQRLGIVVLTNADGHNDLYDAVATESLDRFAGAPRRDWSAIRLRQANARESALDSLRNAAEARRPRGTKPLRSLEAYAGRYTNQMYGDLLVVEMNGRLVLRIGTLTADLEHWANDVFEATWRGAPNPVLGPVLVEFSSSPFDAVTSLRVSDDPFLPVGSRIWENDEFLRR
jgi:CubicO group peptidase (beta-lactamase class C family)